MRALFHAARWCSRFLFSGPFHQKMRRAVAGLRPVSIGMSTAPVLARALPLPFLLTLLTLTLTVLLSGSGVAEAVRLRLRARYPKMEVEAHDNNKFFAR